MVTKNNDYDIIIHFKLQCRSTPSYLLHIIAIVLLLLELWAAMYASENSFDIENTNIMLFS